jgi:hypothetical protein
VTGALAAALTAAGQQQQQVAAMSDTDTPGPATPAAGAPSRRSGWDELTVVLMGADPATLAAAAGRMNKLLQSAAAAAGLNLPCPLINTLPIPGPVFGPGLGTTATSSYFTLLLRSILPAADPTAAAGFRRYAGAQPWRVWRLSPVGPSLVQQLLGDLGEVSSRGRGDSSRVTAFEGGQLAPALQQLAGGRNSSSNPARSVASAAAAAIRRRMPGGQLLEAGEMAQPGFPLPDLLPRTPEPLSSSSSPRCEVPPAPEPAPGPESVASSSEAMVAGARRRLQQEAPGAEGPPSTEQVEPGPQQQQQPVDATVQEANTTAAEVPPGSPEQQAVPPEANTTQAVGPSPSPEPAPAETPETATPPPQPEKVAAAAGGPPGPGLPSLDAWSSILGSGLLPGGPRAAAAAARGITLVDLGPDPTLRAAQGEGGAAAAPANERTSAGVQEWRDSNRSGPSPRPTAGWGASWGLPSLAFLMPRATSSSNTTSGEGSTPPPLAQLAGIAAAAASTTASALASRAALAAAAWQASPAASDAVTSNSTGEPADGCTLPGAAPGGPRPPPEQLLAPALDLLVGRLAAAAEREGAAVAHSLGAGAALELAGGLDWGGDCLAARVDLCNGEVPGGKCRVVW